MWERELITPVARILEIDFGARYVFYGFFSYYRNSVMGGGIHEMEGGMFVEDLDRLGVHLAVGAEDERL